eukprot:m.25860 g.25860  ORF g.25860 m.25860 type:complete len:187 (+) comp8775_c1_seq1:113-673(+)
MSSVQLTLATLAVLAACAFAVPLKTAHLAPSALNATLGCSKWTLYKQCDSSWGNNKLGTSSNTICSAGCAMSSVAMMLKTKGANYNPGTLNEWLKNNGGYASGDLLVWSAVNKLGVVSFQAIENPDIASVQSGLSSCHGIIANVRGGSHWVLLTGYAGSNKFYVNDPGFSQSTYEFSEMLRFAVYH